jgi:alpha-L-fucosidase 2
MYFPFINSFQAWRRVLMAATASIAAGAAIAPAANAAQTLNDIAINTGASAFSQVLDVQGSSRAIGAQVIQWPSNGGANQRWNVVPDANGYEHIVNVNSGLCLATNGTPGNAISQWACSNSTQEDWTGIIYNNPFSSDQDHSWLANPASGTYLSVNGGSPWPGAQLIAWPSASSGQRFIYTQY